MPIFCRCFFVVSDKSTHLSDLPSSLKLSSVAVAGGFGEKVATYYGDSDMRVFVYGADKEFTDRVPLEELYKQFHLTKEQIVKDIEHDLK